MLKDGTAKTTGMEKHINVNKMRSSTLFIADRITNQLIFVSETIGA